MGILGLLASPYCGHQQQEEIPVDACVSFYQCWGCGQMVSAVKRCCVFCDYGDRLCLAAFEHGSED